LKVNIEELENMPDRQMILHFDEKIEISNSVNAVKGDFNVSSTGYVVNVSGNIETDIVLECDRCLRDYSFNIKVDINENFVKGRIIPEEAGEFELKKKNFVEELGDKKEIDITDLVYQTIILEIPNQKLCDINCKGVEGVKKEQDMKDPRLKIFEDISKTFE